MNLIHAMSLLVTVLIWIWKSREKNSNSMEGGIAGLMNLLLSLNILFRNLPEKKEEKVIQNLNYMLSYFVLLNTLLVCDFL